LRRKICRFVLCSINLYGNCIVNAFVRQSQAGRGKNERILSDYAIHSELNINDNQTVVDIHGRHRQFSAGRTKQNRDTDKRQTSDADDYTTNRKAENPKQWKLFASRRPSIVEREKKTFVSRSLSNPLLLEAQNFSSTSFCSFLALGERSPK